MSTHPVIEARQVVKEFPLGKKRTYSALRGIDISVKPGEFVILFGPSGSGKSTLLNLVAGLEMPSSGTIKIRGRDITKFTHQQLASHHRTKIGMVFQQFNLVPTLSVVENIALPQIFANKPLHTRLNRAHHLLDIFGLDKFANNSPQELSGGEQQRVAIARSLANNPWILLVDEPTGNLDSVSGQEVMDLISDLNEHSRRTILLVTHDDSYLDRANRVVYLLDGKIVKEEKKKQYRSPAERTVHPLARLHVDHDHEDRGKGEIVNATG